jgi:enamine deaminase RidA (YjgF/YER057c/UK114 family)
MAAKIEKYCAPGVYDPPGYSQAIKVTGAQTILFLAGQVPYEMDGTVKHRGDFRRARCSARSRRSSRRVAAPSPTS